MALPMPIAAPVTTAIWPFNAISDPRSELTRGRRLQFLLVKLEKLVVLANSTHLIKGAENSKATMLKAVNLECDKGREN